MQVNVLYVIADMYLSVEFNFPEMTYWQITTIYI